MLVLLDVDGVVANLLPVWLDYLNKDFGENLGVDDITSYDLRKFVKSETRPWVGSYLGWDGLYDRVRPINGAVDGVKKIRRMGHVVKFLTSDHNLGKLRWLQLNGFTVAGASEVIVSHDKGLVSGDVLVDDYPHNVRRFRGDAVLFSTKYNLDENVAIRVFGWEGVVEFIRAKTYFEKQGVAQTF